MVATKTRRTSRKQAPASSPKPSKRAEYGDRVFQHIPTQGAAPITGDDLAAAARLSKDQIQKGVAYLRDTFPEFPLISSPRGYHFTIDADAVDAFRQTRAKSALTIISRTWSGAIKPYLAHLTNQPGAVVVQKQFTRVIEDLGDLVR